jgi:hypothetical protein
MENDIDLFQMGAAEKHWGMVHYYAGSQGSAGYHQRKA